jgi:hypothetical protein
MQANYAFAVVREWAGEEMAQRITFAVLHPDSWRLIAFDLEPDEALIQLLLTAVDRTWEQVQSGLLPVRLDPKDPRCARCPWRLTCQGDAVPLLAPADRGELDPAPDLELLLHDLREADELCDATTETRDVLRDALRSALDGRTAVSCGGTKVYNRPQMSKRLSAEMVKSKYPTVATECTVEQVSTPLRVYWPKGE